MAKEVFVPDQVKRTGTKPSEHAGLSAANTFAFVNKGQAWIRIKNGNAAITKVKVITQEKVDGLAVANREVEIAKNETKLIGPFPIAEFNNEENQVEFTLSQAEEVTVEIVRF